MTMEWILFKTVLSLVAVLALMVGVVLALKKYVYRGSTGGGQVVPVEILGQRSLHPKRSIVVVKVLDSVFVVGMSEQGMQTIGTIESEDALAQIAEKLTVEEPAARWMGWKTGTSEAKGMSSFAVHLQESLKGFLRRQNGANTMTGRTERPGNGTRRPRRPA